LPLFDWSPRARTSDPRTSKVAGERAQRFARGHAALIIKALVEHGPGTASEVGARCGLSVVQVDRRALELVNGGWVLRFDHGRRELVLVATAKSEEWCRA
jgi:hypothetical protein